MENTSLNPTTSFDILSFSKEELINFYYKHEELNHQYKEQSKHVVLLEKENVDLKALSEELKSKIIEINGQLVSLKSKIFGRKSEKSIPNKKDTQNADTDNKKNKDKPKKRKKTNIQPSKRYPDATIVEQEIELCNRPICNCCQKEMVDSGMTENSEYLTVIPKKYIIIRQIRHKYCCYKCHDAIITAPCPKRIIPSSSYSDDMVIDIAMTKYCDLIPIERYTTIAGREGLSDLPANSLIETTHKLADFAEDAYNGVKKEITESIVLHADETPHKMLEGDDKKNWFLWGFSNAESSYFEIRNTRSGNVASELLANAKCQFLVSDVFSGYEKAVNESNKVRKEKELPGIINVYCNAHSRRKFKEAAVNFPEEAAYYLEKYKEIYFFEKEGRSGSSDLLLENRKKMKTLFADMKNKAESDKNSYSSKSSLATAVNYLINNYPGLTIFLININLPIDNNHEERQLRSPVVGRKTWYGTHSKRGAKTASILFTLVESCKLNDINPRKYFKYLVELLHAKKEAITPREFKLINLDTT